MSVKVILAAAGSGRRIGSDVPKQYMPLADVPLIVHTLFRFQHSTPVDEIVLVVRPEEVEWVKSAILAHYSLGKVTRVTGGGAQRQDSVACGMRQIWDLVDDHDIIMVHDGVRPFIDQGMIARCIAGAQEQGACIAALRIFETVKRVGEQDALVHSTLPSQELWIAQTPQAFRASLLKDALMRAQADGFVGTDESSLVERLPHPVKVIDGSYWNIKITYPHDFRIAEQIMKWGIIR